MEVERHDDGHWGFRLGPIEKRAVIAGSGVLVLALGWIFTSITGEIKSQGQRLEKMNESQQAMVTQQAVTNGQIGTLSKQLADVPELTRQMAEIRVRVEQHDEDIRELRQVKGLR